MRNDRLLAAFLMLAPLPALAQVTLTGPNAVTGAEYVAHFRVAHGCSGSPTLALTVEIPSDISNPRPQATDGWTTATVRANGKIIAVTWKGNRLAADKPGEFVLAMKLPAVAGPVAFPALQTCEKGVTNWSQLPAGDGRALKNPAPVLAVSAPAPAPPGTLTLSDGWIRLLPGRLPAGGYFTLRNNGTAKIALTGAESPACGMLMLHKSSATGGMTSMQHVTEVEVPGRGSVSFSPGGYHLMCMDPKPLLKQGASVPVTLSFQGSAPLTARFDVRGATGK